MTDEQYALITLSTSALMTRWSMSRDEVRQRRVALLGRSRAVQEPWVHAVGSWGGVRTAREIGLLVKRTPREVRDYAKGMDLRVQTKTYSRTQAELAVRLWCDRGRPVRESCREHGVLPVERYLLCAQLTDVIRASDNCTFNVLCGTVGELNDAWARAGDPFARKRTSLEAMFEEVEGSLRRRGVRLGEV